MLSTAVLFIVSTLSQPAVAKTASVDVNIVAHQDDDILFMNPDILNAVVAGHDQVTVFLTGGNVRTDDFWYTQGRENGAMHAYSKILQIADTIRSASFAAVSDQCVSFGSPLSDNPGLVRWATDQRQYGTYSVQVANSVGPLPLKVSDQKDENDEARARILLIFLRIAASRSLVGDPINSDLQGNNYDPLDNGPPLFATLGQLWKGLAPVSRTSDGVMTYTRERLIDVLKSILMETKPEVIRTQDSDNPFAVDGREAKTDENFSGLYDHSDHYYGALFAREALSSTDRFNRKRIPHTGSTTATTSTVPSAPRPACQI